MRTLTITAAEWASVHDGTLWLVREGVPSVAYGYHPPADMLTTPPVEFVQACAPCDRCEEGCDITMCLDCGEDYSEPCARHLTAGHHASADPYGDSVDCHACCPDCRIALVGPCQRCKGAGFRVTDNGSFLQRSLCSCGGGRCTVTLGHAYAIGQPLTQYADRTADLAHYGPPESLVGKKWALQVQVVA